MGRKAVFSAVLVAGLTQMTPALAQAQGPQQETGGKPVASAQAQPAPARIWVPSVRIAGEGRRSAVATVEARAKPAVEVAEDAPRPLAPPAEALPTRAAAVKVAKEAPPPEAVAAEAGSRQPDLADKDLAAVPPEEAKPVLIDPTAARRRMASAGRGALPPREAAKPVLAASEPVERSLPAPRANDPEVIQAERVVATVQNRVDGPPMNGAAPEAVVADGEAASLPEPARADPESEPALAAAGPVLEPAEDIGGDTVMARVERAAASESPVALPAPGGDSSLARTARAAASRTVRAVEDRASPPVYADQEPAPRPRYDERGIDTRPVSAEDEGGAMGPGYPEDLREVRPVYADDDRDIRNPYPQDGGEPLGGYDDRGLGGRPRYAMVEPGLRPADRRWVDRDCDDGRAYRLQQRLRRAVRDGIVNGRAAQDIEDDIGHVDDMHRNYCLSGMTDWREERLDREYAQIEDRLRFEEDFNRRD